MAHIAKVEDDLRILCDLAGSGFPEAKKAGEVALMKLRSSKDDTGRKKSDMGSDAVVKPLLLACSTKDKGLVDISFSAIQKLISFNVFESNPRALESIVSAMLIQLQSQRESVHLRILQTISLLASNSTKGLTEEGLKQALGICFRLFDSSSQVIHHTAEATLRQVVGAFFERASCETNTAAAWEKESVQCAMYLLKDCGKILEGKETGWIRQGSSHVPQTLAAELIELILDGFSTFLCTVDDFLVIIKAQICGAVYRLLQEEHDFPLFLRLVRLVTCITLHYQSHMQDEALQFVRMLAFMLDPENDVWVQVMALEALKRITTKKEAYYALHSFSDHESGGSTLFGFMLHSIGRVLQQSHLASNQRDLLSQLWKNHVRNSKGFDLLHESDPPDFDPILLVSLSAQSFANVIQCLQELSFSTSPSSIRDRVQLSGTLLAQEEVDMSTATIPTYEQVQQMASIAWTPLFTGMKILLERATKRPQIEQLLSSFEELTVMCRICAMDKPMWDLLQSLVQYTLPEEAVATSISIKTAAGFHALLRIANSLANILGPLWLVLLEAFQSLDRILVENISVQSDAASKDTLTNLQGKLDALIIQSASIEDEAWSHFVYALGSLSLATVANLATNDTAENERGAMYTQVNMTEDMNPPRHLFALTRLVESLELHPCRASRAWAFYVDHITCLLNQKDPALRCYGVSCYTRLAKKLLEAGPPTDASAFASDVMKASCSVPSNVEEYYEYIIGPIVDLYGTKQTDSKKYLILATHNLLQVWGMQLGSTWHVPLYLLSFIAKEARLDMVALAFKTLQLIVDEYVDQVPTGQLQALIDSIALFGEQSCANNISFTSIGLLWQVSDQIRASIAEKVDAGTYRLSQQALLHKLGHLCLDRRSEVRNSAVQTLHATVVANGDLFDAAVWKSVLGPILFELLHEVCDPSIGEKRGDSTVASASALGTNRSTGEQMMMMTHHSRDTAEKQWSETQVHMIQGITRVVRQFFATLSQQDSIQQTWETFVMALQNAIMQLSSEVALCSIQCIQDTLQTEAVATFLSERHDLLDTVVSAYNAIVAYGIDNCDTIDIQVYTNLLESVAALLADPHFTCFRSSDITLFLQLADALSSVHFKSLGSPKRHTNSKETSLQRATLHFIASLSSTHTAPEIWTAAVDQVLEYIEAAIPLTEEEGSISRMAFAARALPVLATLYVSKLPLQQKRDPSLFFKVLQGAGQVLCSDSIPNDASMYAAAITTFIQVSEHGLAILHKSPKVSPSKGVNEVWDYLCKTLRHVLCSEAPMGCSEVEQTMLRLIQSVGTVFLQQSWGSSAAHREQLLQLLAGMEQQIDAQAPRTLNRQTLHEFGLESLFRLCSETCAPDKVELVEDAIPVLHQWCQRVLHRFTLDERRSGKRPMPYSRLRETQFLLHCLLRYPCVTEPPSQSLTLRLYPLLCDCVVIQDDQVKEQVRQLLHVVGKELDLE